MNSTDAGTVLPLQWDLLHSWLRRVCTHWFSLPPAPFGGHKCFSNPSVHTAWLEEVFSTSSCVDGYTCSTLVPGMCVVLIQAVLQHSALEAARERTSSMEQSSCEGEGRGVVQKGHWHLCKQRGPAVLHWHSYQNTDKWI